MPTPTDPDSRVNTAGIEHLQDDELEILNDLLPWQCFTLDSKGRQFGRPASEIKRHSAQKIPDRRVVELNRRFSLDGSRVLEIGCFEGVHSVALAAAGANLTAVDGRIENVVKTLVRAWAFGYQINALKCDVERPEDAELLPQADVLHHVGVLYHLVDPVAHLNQVLPRIGSMVMLDTHFVKEDEATECYDSGGESYRFKNQHEGGRTSAFSGMYDHAKWLTLDAIESIFRANGFGKVDVSELREERNGDRVLVFASR